MSTVRSSAIFDICGIVLLVRRNTLIFIFIISSDIYVLIISECDVLLMHRKKASQIIFVTFLDFYGNLAQVI